MRNEYVGEAVNKVISLLDRLADGEILGPPASPALRSLFDDNASGQGGSVTLAYIFLAAYSLVDKTWDHKAVPIGVRGVYGDKRLSTELSLRHVTLHRNITAFGENLGWKGAVRQFDLSQDIRFSTFLEGLAQLNEQEKEQLLKHMAWRLHESRAVPQALPPVPATYLSYARSLVLCERLLAIPSEGHIQQFLVSAFLEIHRRRYGHRVVTHHPHASDKFDGSRGDIEEYRDYELVGVYEVTVRSDWKNRLADFGMKISDSGISKYVIIAAGVRRDSELSPAVHLLDFLSNLSYDLAVVDINDFFAVFCAELQREEIAAAINRTYQLLLDPRMSGRGDILEKFREATNLWLDRT